MINVRLWIEYALVGVLVASAGLAVANHFRVQVQAEKVETVTAKLDKAQQDVKHVEERLTTAETVNATQQTVILDLANQREVDGQRILELVETYSTLSQSDKLLRNRLLALEKDDAAKRYLDNPIPESVACVYDGTCEVPTAPATADSKNGGPEGVPSKAAPAEVRTNAQAKKAG